MSKLNDKDSEGGFIKGERYERRVPQVSGPMENGDWRGLKKLWFGV